MRIHLTALGADWPAATAEPMEQHGNRSLAAPATRPRCRMTTSGHSGRSETDPLTKPGKSVRPRTGKLPARKSASWIGKILKVLGPGLITGAADDDPSGIATYSSVGAQYGYGMLWTMPFVYPFMAGIQEISARLGRVTGRGIAGNMRQFYPRWLLYILVGLLLFANVINLGRISARWALQLTCWWAVQPFSIAFCWGRFPYFFRSLFHTRSIP